ncbi:hypothetical protein F2P81_003242 [Scophthalmus maximus]|uniref:Uncharacterized protein n=1 Tax=Scophthalmus maximus TaxID=52904 RepID=A0A6A4TLJ9_SCOMX|nr:hypothetical protein F2P81_003242 [Scophthalmus maximus]
MGSGPRAQGKGCRRSSSHSVVTSRIRSERASDGRRRCRGDRQKEKRDDRTQTYFLIPLVLLSNRPAATPASASLAMAFRFVSSPPPPPPTAGAFL